MSPEIMSQPWCSVENPCGQKKVERLEHGSKNEVYYLTVQNEIDSKLGTKFSSDY